MKNDMQSKLEISSVPLIKINDAKLPGGFASGCLMDYNGKRLLLTVAHAAKKGPPLCLALGWDPKTRKVGLWRLGALNFLAKLQLDVKGDLQKSNVPDIDFAYVDVPTDLDPKLEKIDPQTGNILQSRSCTVWSESAIAEPTAEGRYGFAGHTMPSLEDHTLIAPDVKFCCTVHRICFPLTYIGQEDDTCAFRLPVEHPGHDYFRGCSGAPIIDEEGHVVALVSKGSEEDSIVFGISLRWYQFALDIHTGRFG